MLPATGLCPVPGRTKDQPTSLLLTGTGYRLTSRAGELRSITGNFIFTSCIGLRGWTLALATALPLSIIGSANIDGNEGQQSKHHCHFFHPGHWSISFYQSYTYCDPFYHSALSAGYDAESLLTIQVTPEHDRLACSQMKNLSFLELMEDGKENRCKQLRATSDAIRGTLLWISTFDLAIVLRCLTEESKSPIANCQAFVANCQDYSLGASYIVLIIDNN